MTSPWQAASSRRLRPRIDPRGAKTIDASAFTSRQAWWISTRTRTTGTGERRSFTGDNSVYPDGFTFRAGVTTIVDAGSSGWRNFEDFHDRVVCQVPHPRAGAAQHRRPRHARRDFQQDVTDMEVAASRRDGRAATAARDRRLQDRALPGARLDAGGPCRGRRHAHRASGDGGLPARITPSRRATRRPALTEAATAGTSTPTCYPACGGNCSKDVPIPRWRMPRARGVIFDVGHGAGSFRWRVAVPIVQAGFLPDSISTDLHTSSMKRRG